MKKENNEEFFKWMQDHGWYEAADGEYDNANAPNRCFRLTIHELYRLYEEEKSTGINNDIKIKVLDRAIDYVKGSNHTIKDLPDIYAIMLGCLIEI